MQKTDKRVFVILMGFMAVGLQALSFKFLSPLMESASPGFTKTGAHHILITAVTLAIPVVICHFRMEPFTGRFADKKTTIVWGGALSVVIIAFNVGLFETASLIATGELHVPGVALPTTGIAMFLAIAVVGPVAEEALYRGYILKVLSERNSVLAAILVTSALAIMLHAVKYPRIEITYFIVKFAQSVIISIAYVRGRLGASIVVHIVNNVTALTAF